VQGLYLNFEEARFPKKTRPPYHLFNPGWGEYADDQPAVYLTWNDAERFLAWLSAREKRAYRLPTQAEWEWACRAGSGARHYWGTDVAVIDQFVWSRRMRVAFPQPV